MIAQALLACLPLVACPASTQLASPLVQDEESTSISEVEEGDGLSSASALTSRFVAIVHEHTGRHHIRWGDQVVTLWDIRPEQTDTPAVRRCTLGRSYWNATPVFDSPSLLRWQVPKSTSGFDVRILRVDYSTFEVTQLLVLDRVHASGRWGDKLYLKTLGESKVLDVQSGVLTDQGDVMERLASHGADWLVGLDGVLARFDAAEAKIVRSYADIALDPAPVFAMQPQWDGGRYAAGLGSFFGEDGARIAGLEFGHTEIVYWNLRCWDLDFGTERKIRVRIQARGGSGRPILPINVYVEIEGGRLRYTERFPATGEHASLDEFNFERDTEWVTIDLASGKELSREACTAESIQGLGYQAQILKTVPEYLRDLYTESPIQAWGADQDVAHAFLTYKGVELKLPSDGVCKLDSVGRSANGSELLVLNRGIFYLCNLETQELKQWSAPPEMNLRDGVGLYALDAGVPLPNEKLRED